MRAALLGAALLAASGGAALAQAAVNPGALDQLRPAPQERGRRSAPHPRRAPAQSAVPERPAAPLPEATKPVAARPGQPAAPPVPAAPPTPAALPPPAVVVPTAAPLPPPPVAVADDAPGGAEPLPGGVRVTFGKDRSDLNPAVAAAIRQVAGQARGTLGALDVTAYAAGAPDDPSTPRRLSLSRALAVRAVLLREGIESARIYVHAMGAASDAGTPAVPADRVDVVRQGTPAPGAGGAQASGK